MCKRFLFFIVLFISLRVMGADVTPQEALQQAQQFVQQRMGLIQGRKGAPAVIEVEQAAALKGLYLFNVEAGNGYVIVSGDDRFPPILGYSDHGTLDVNNMPQNMKAWLQGYADEMAWAKEQVGGQQLKVLKRAASEVKTAIAPLVQSVWNQNAPFNNNCPEYETGKKCATGCVATAMAQVMNYYQWPDATTAEIPGYTSKTNQFVLDAIAEGTAIDWNNMLMVYSGNYTSAQAEAVANLMYYCGVSVQMDYGKESGAVSESVTKALKQYFDYDETATTIYRSDYDYADWIDIMYHELSQNRPIVYGGMSSGGGHEFVCDGYQGEDFFHINWGWSGTSDGYFKLSALNPYEQGIGGSTSSDGYHYAQDAVVGIKPNGAVGDVLPIEPKTNSLKLNSITVDKDAVNGGETVTVTMNITNENDAVFDGDIFLYDFGAFELLDDSKSFRIPAGATVDCVMDFTPENETKTYKLTAVYMNAGKFKWPGILTRATLTVTETDIETTDNIVLQQSVAFENVIGTSFYGPGSGNKLKATLTITNPETDKIYHGTYQADIYQYGSNYNTLKGRTLSTITIPAGQSITMTVEADNLENGEQYRLQTIYIKGNGNSGWTRYPWYTAKAGVTSYLPDGTTAVTVPAETYQVPDNALCVELTGTGVTSVTENNNPNCLYIVAANETVPAGLENVITYDGSGYSAEQISLTDNSEFCSPVDFTASRIELTYANTLAADGTKGWNTIIVPFDVTRVTANGTTIDWFRSDTDENKNFWLKKFVGDEAAKVYFAYETGSMKAYTPYIIALPGNKWGSRWNLTGKTIKFIGENVFVGSAERNTVVTGRNYRFVGDTQAVTSENIYCLNAQGNKFVLTNGHGAFRACFKPDSFDRTVNQLSIGTQTDDDATAIPSLSGGSMTDPTTNAPIYNLHGQCVRPTSHGLYIRNGRKVAR